MSFDVVLLAVAAASVLLVALLWWLLVTTEGVFLGRRVVIWLYDLYARRYDAIKQFDAFNEAVFLAQPLLYRLRYMPAPLVLDVATGTGRLPLALLEQPDYQGRVIGVDLSRRMLTLASDKLAPHASRVTLLHGPAEDLPFPPDTFDCVTCLEALEFMMEPRAVLRELVRVLRPGGLLVLTNRQGWQARTMPGHTFRHEALEHLLSDDFGLEDVDIQVWQVDYRIVWAWKPGRTPPAGARPFEEIWQCPACGQIDWVPVNDGWRCLHCEALVPRGADGVVEQLSQ